MNRLNAATAGLKTYDPDKPCRKGHVSQRYTTTGNCIACLKEHRTHQNGVLAGNALVSVLVPKHLLPSVRQFLDGLMRADASALAYLSLYTKAPLPPPLAPEPPALSPAALRMLQQMRAQAEGPDHVPPELR